MLSRSVLVRTARSPLLGQRTTRLQKKYSMAKLPAVQQADGAAQGGAVTVEETIDGKQMLSVKYLRKDQNYKGWGLHAWGDVQKPTDWDKPLKSSRVDSDGACFEVELGYNANSVGLLMHRGEVQGARAEPVDVRAARQVWLVGGEQQAFLTQPDINDLPAGDLFKSHAHWVKRNTIVWRVSPTEDGEASSPQRQFFLHFSRDAKLSVTGHGVDNADTTLQLRVRATNISSDVMARYPHLYGCTTLELPEDALEKVPDLLQGQVAVSVHMPDGKQALDATGVQLAGVLDDLFATDAPLGNHSDEACQAHVVSVWAPTAQKVELLHWMQARGGEPTVQAMERGKKGVWSLQWPADWLDTFYKYRVTVFCPWTNSIETMEVTDPYSRATTANGERTIFADMSAQQLVPPGWSEHRSPPLAHWTDVSVYELHIRDFSATDSTVPESLRGKYRAFCPEAHATVRADSSDGTSTHDATANGSAASELPSAGLRHLAGLRDAGLNHIHLLPSYDYGSVPEREEEQKRIWEDLSKYPPDSEYQQAAVLAIADDDAFNWGYDPVHYGVPEGSYSTAPDSTLRVREYREMVQSLHNLGLRVVLDVVYNHTFASGPHTRHSVLDKVVPGYYHRRMEDGEMCHSTCCNNTASEHAMFERLMVDDLVHWARHYRVDGFRFDIMGHHSMSTMGKIRAALDSLTPKRDGVDGKSMYIYGEAWDFGEVACNQRFRNASQQNLGGSKIGGFNDRMRDGAMGGSPYQPPDCQGFVTGLATDPNDSPHQGAAEQQRQTLLQNTDWVRFSLAGNLREYEMQVADGRVLAGGQGSYHGQPGGLAYGAHPAENVVFNGCHDNETIFDQVMLKAARHASAEDRAYMCRLALALLAFSQGIPFFHAGDDLLRSKSLDRDAYNSGDWFNAIDWTGQDNGFGRGLPVASKNAATWPLKRPLLAQAERYKPRREVIAASAEWFKALLRVRYSSPLFRMPTAEHIKQQVRFHNTGPDQVPGVLLMQLSSSGSQEHGTWDAQYEQVLVVFNARPQPYEAAFPPGLDHLQLHPALAALSGDGAVQACSADNAAKQLRVSARMAAVFVQQRR